MVIVRFSAGDSMVWVQVAAEAQRRMHRSEHYKQNMTMFCNNYHVHSVFPARSGKGGIGGFWYRSWDVSRI